MSEYIEIEAELDEEDNTLIHFFTNLPLAPEQMEQYESVEAMAEGSAVAQVIAAVEGVLTLQLAGSKMLIRRDETMPEYTIIAEVSALLKDFFL